MDGHQGASPADPLQQGRGPLAPAAVRTEQVVVRVDHERLRRLQGSGLQQVEVLPVEEVHAPGRERRLHLGRARRRLVMPTVAQEPDLQAPRGGRGLLRGLRPGPFPGIRGR